MAPLPPSSCAATSTHNSCNRSRVQRRGHDDKVAGSAARTAAMINPSPPERSASFHGRPTHAPLEQRQMRRPKTQPDLLAGARGAMSPIYKEDGSSSSSSSWKVGAAERRVPAKVLVNVSVQRSLLGPLQVMASSEWTVADLVAAVVRLYVKEGRRPQLLTAEPSELSLHYSQFSLESLDPKEKLIGLGSRNFFLCYKSAAASATAVNVASTTKNTSSSTAAAAAADVTSACTSSSSSSSCSKEAEKGSKVAIPWLRFMDSLL